MKIAENSRTMLKQQAKFNSSKLKKSLHKITYEILWILAKKKKNL